MKKSLTPILLMLSLSFLTCLAAITGCNSNTEESKLKAKKSALKRMARRKEIEHLRKLGKMK